MVLSSGLWGVVLLLFGGFLYLFTILLFMAGFGCPIHGGGFVEDCVFWVGGLFEDS